MKKCTGSHKYRTDGVLSSYRTALDKLKGAFLSNKPFESGWRGIEAAFKEEIGTIISVFRHVN